MESAIETLRAETRKPELVYAYEENRTSRREESYRDYLNSRRVDRRAPQPIYRGSYSSTLLLLVVILALGYSAFQNHQKMESMERALNQMELQAVMQTEAEHENGVRVEEVIGNVTPSQTTELPQASSEVQNTTSTQNPQDMQVPATQTQATQVQETDTQFATEQATQTMSESDIYLAQGYYVVQAGDSLAGICRKIYHTTAMLDELCELNDIDDADAIFAGQRLILPD